MWICWGTFWLVFSAWASGLSFSKPRWQPPRVMWASRLMLSMDDALKTVVKRSILELHEERNTLSHRLLSGALMLSDIENLSYPQKLERALWTQVAVVASLCLILGFALAAI